MSKKEKFRQFLHEQVKRSRQYADDINSRKTPIKILIFTQEDLIELKKIVLGRNEEANISEKEKRAIENAKEYVENEEVLSVSTFDIKRLLNLIKKQRKELEDLKDVQQQICNEELLKREYVQNNYIRKDKIRETIKDIDKYTVTFFNIKAVILAIKNSLNKLLEE